MKSLLIKMTIIGVITLCLPLSGMEEADPLVLPEISEAKKDSSEILKEIYREVVELGKFPGDDFIKREFFVGKDDDDTYQDIHVLVLIQDVDKKEKITIQVTYFQPSKSNSVVRLAKNTRSISYTICSII